MAAGTGLGRIGMGRRGLKKSTFNSDFSDVLIETLVFIFKLCFDSFKLEKLIASN